MRLHQPGEAIGSCLGSIATMRISIEGVVYARVTVRPLLTAEEMDKAVEKTPPVPGTAEASACHLWHRVRNTIIGAQTCRWQRT